MKLKIIFIVVLLYTVTKVQGCPPSCECFGEYVSCNHATSIPRELEPSLSSLSLPHHYITSINQTDFAGYASRLKQLSITNGTLQTIANGAFVQMGSLLTLDLHNTRISSINTNTFIGLDNLLRLNLSGTHIAVLEAKPFTALKSLEILDLRRNHQFLKVSDEAFDGLIGLHEMFLGSRDLAVLSAIAFERLVSIRHLVLQDLPFESLDDESFPTIPTLEELCIDRWKNLREVGSFTNSIPNVTELSITAADLGRVPVEALQSDKLEVLKLDDNPGVKSLRLHDFEGTRNLRELSLSNTGLTTIHEAPFHDNLHLVSLDLSRNHLAVLPVHTLFRLSHLEKLNLSRNNFTTLRPNAFGTARSLKEIDLSGNKMICDCDLRWLKNWHSLNIRDRHIYGSCDSPRSHKGTSIAGIESKFFICAAPHFEVHDVKLSLPMNQSSTIDCVPDEGSPDPVVTWSDSEARHIPIMADVTELQSRPGMWQLPNGSLHIENMGRLIDGIYRCTAANKEGSSVKTYNLKTKSPLEPIEIPRDAATSTTAIVMIIIGLLLPLGGVFCYVKKRSAYKGILEDGSGVKWNSV